MKAGYTMTMAAATVAGVVGLRQGDGHRFQADWGDARAKR